MPTLLQLQNVDLESDICNDGGPTAHRKPAAATVGGGGEPPRSVNANEIVGVGENNGDNIKIKHERKESSVSDHSVEIVDLGAGPPETRLQFPKTVRDCRICHLSMDGACQDSGFPMELGCSCKDDLAAAHKQCAEAWFKIKGNKICEICGSIAQNVAGVYESELTEQWNEGSDVASTATAPAPHSESRNFWQGHRFLNFLLACMVFAFVVSWLFHFNIPS